ncbi:winged helix-turn-helix domain-containing protein [Streptomyces sp. NBC_00487]|uniref:winged helix-turn-helix domain-containing protein n=1 Tax=unclassified Streptomyces TaxID=2593676 RepID=UPI002E19C156|nr:MULTISPECIES: winged helix-turn-helix domain-containing protein [unclassified Streptomyces]
MASWQPGTTPYVGAFPRPTASDLAERYGLEKSTVSRRLSQLEEGFTPGYEAPGRGRTGSDEGGVGRPRR